MRISPMAPGGARWTAKDLPGGVEEARLKLRDLLLARTDPGGALREPCRSRVLESALMMRALERTHQQPQARRRLSDYLRQHRNTADPVDRMLVAAALDDRAASDPAVMARFLDQVPDFTGTRKRSTLAAFLAVLGVPPGEGETVSASAACDALHSWARVQVTAVKVILAAATGQRGLVTDADVALLLSTQAGPDVWERNLLVHLSVVHALAGLGGHQEVTTAGVRKALRYQRADGGMPFISDTDTWCTATGGVALAAAGTPPEALHRLAGHLVERQRPDGGWSFTDHAELTDVDDISVALEFLQQLDAVRYSTTIGRGLCRLHELRCAEGGFPTYAGTPPEACMTAAAVNALNARPLEHRSLIVDGLDFLCAHQRDDGTFPPDWSSSRFHTVFRAVLAGTHPSHATSPHVREMTDRALAAVRSGQNGDGGWGRQPGDPSDAVSTSYALIALSRQDDPRQVAPGVEYLLGSVREDGGVASVPDSIGPRPFVFAIPALADIFGLLALGHLTARAAGAPRQRRRTSQTRRQSA